MSLVNLITLDSIEDSRGSLIAFDKNKNINFDIKRIYYIFNTPSDITRGYHAHQTLKQLLICTSGSCLVLLDDGTKRETVLLHKKDQALFVGPMIWHEMSEFSHDCVLMVIASDYYDESDYIRDYRNFLNKEINCDSSNGNYLTKS